MFLGHYTVPLRGLASVPVFGPADVSHPATGDSSRGGRIVKVRLSLLNDDYLGRAQRARLVGQN